MNTLVVRVL